MGRRSDNPDDLPHSDETLPGLGLDVLFVDMMDDESATLPDGELGERLKQAMSPTGALDRVIKRLEKGMPFILHADITHPDELYKGVLNEADRYSDLAVGLSTDGTIDRDAYFDYISRLIHNVIIPLAVRHCDISEKYIQEVIEGMIFTEYVHPGFVDETIFNEIEDSSDNIQEFIDTESGRRFLPRIFTLMYHLIDMKAREMIAKLGNEDPLTGLENRRGGQAEFERIVARVKRAGYPGAETASKPVVSVLIFDIDHFRKFNNDYDHAVGDAVLQAVASIVKDCAKRPDDVVVRWGGEEFVVILPNTDEAGARKIAEAINVGIEARAIEIAKKESPHANALLSPDKDRKVTVTIAVDTFDQNEVPPELEEAIKSADDTLMRAKEADNRNSVNMVGDSE